MNEKEALTGLKNLSQIFKLCSENDVKLKDFNIINPKAYKEAIETILDLYNKEKEKNIELEDYKDKFFKLHESYNRVVEKLNNSISKDKIKERYEKNKARTDCRYCNNTCDSYAVCMFCKELLEEK